MEINMKRGDCWHCPLTPILTPLQKDKQLIKKWHSDISERNGFNSKTQSILLILYLTKMLMTRNTLVL